MDRLVLIGVKDEYLVLQLLDRAAELEGLPTRSDLLRQIIRRYLQLPPAYVVVGRPPESPETRGE